MKKNLIFITGIFICLLFLVSLSYFIMEYNDGSRYKFNDNIDKNDLLNLYLNDDQMTICENCIYTCSNWDEDISSSLLRIEYDENNSVNYETVNVYDEAYTTGLDVSLGDSYKKILAYYGIREKYAYWNVELANGDIYFYDYPSDIIKSDDVVNAYLNFVYYLDDGAWKLLSPSKYKNVDNKVIDNLDEYILFTFEFSFNGYSEHISDETLAAYSIHYYKRGDN